MSLHRDITNKQEPTRSASERFFMRHFAAVQQVFTNRSIDTVREANDATIAHVWQCLLDGQTEEFDGDTVNHVAAWQLADGPDGFNTETFDRLVASKKRQQRGLERRSRRSVAADVWENLKGTACEVELTVSIY